MDLQAFFADQISPLPELSFHLSDRFPENFHIRAISEEENALLRRKTIKDSSSGELDLTDYLSKLAAACVVCPDLNNASLQRSWGVIGSEALLKKMLSAGEYAALLAKVQSLCGFDVNVTRLADDIKKEPCGAMQN